MLVVASYWGAPWAHNATEYMNGEEKYDYAMIDFLSDDGLSATCPAMILEFL
jgi:hypothetical protein